ncbi:ankyrin repeat-containing domain protein [Mycena crocata]|nr:ankyrin repeat-containing domain protein [Mycena crocata]
MTTLKTERGKPSPTSVTDSRTAKIVDAATSSLEAALDILELLSDLTENVPYLGAVAGCIQKLIDIQKTMSANKERAAQLLENIGELSRVVAQGLKDLPTDKQRSTATEALSADLNRYQIFLIETTKILEEWTSQGQLKRLLKHGDFPDIADGLDRRLNAFRDAFSVSRLISLSNNQEALDTKMQTLVDQNTRSILDQWLKPANVGTSQKDASNKRHAGTGLWLVNDRAEFKDWIYTPASFLWLHGISGCGKTVLSSVIIDTIRGRGEPYAFFYFDTNNLRQRTATQLLCSLVTQLSIQSTAPDKILNAVWTSHARGQHFPGNSVLISEVLIPILKEFREPVHIVLDALDECSEREELFRVMTAIVEAKFANVHLLVTSRPEVPHSTDLADRAWSIPLEGCVDKDIESYVTETVTHKLSWLGEKKDEIKRRLLERSNEMFRLVSLQIDELLNCDGRLSQIEKALTNMPTSLYTIYDRILQNIRNPDMVSSVCRTINWLLFSRQPMKLREIIDAVAFDFDSEPLRFNPAERMRAEALLAACAGLVATSRTDNDDGPTIRLAHSSVREYFLSAKPATGMPGALEISEQAAHYLMARTCIGYLCSFDHVINPYSESAQYPLIEYSLQYWGRHMTLCDDIGLDNCGPSEEWRGRYPIPLFTNLYASNLVFGVLSHFLRVLKLMIPLTGRIEMDVPNLVNDTRNPRHLIATAALGLLHHESPQLRMLPLPESQSDTSPALYVASFLGIGPVVSALLEQGATVNTPGGYYGTALQAACWEGHIETARLLLGEGANINLRGGFCETALVAACHRGHIDIVRLLLGEGANVNAEGGNYGSALQAACLDGNIDVVRLLLREGANVNAEGGTHGNALQAAGSNGNIDIVRLLLGEGADMNAQGGSYGNALQAACRNGNIDIVRLLLREGADVNTQGGSYGNALQAACSDGNIDIVGLLLKEGANVNTEGGYYGSALQAACSKLNGNIDIVRLLLGKGANVNAPGGNYGNALEVACLNGNIDIVRLLLGKGANVNAEGGIFFTALQAASSGGDIEIGQLLLDQGANVNAEGGQYGTALRAARLKGRRQIVQLLIDHGASDPSQPHP